MVGEDVSHVFLQEAVVSELIQNKKWFASSYSDNSDMQLNLPLNLFFPENILSVMFWNFFLIIQDIVIFIMEEVSVLSG